MSSFFIKYYNLFIEIPLKVLYNNFVRMWKFLREFILTVGNDFHGHDIKFILTNYWGFSGSLITDLKKGDYILLNEKKEFVNKVVSCGDILKIVLPETNSDNIVPNAIPLHILYEDDDILLVNKPANMPTHPSIGHFEGTLANAVMHYYSDIPFTFRAVTRLDRDTSGVVLIAKHIVAADRLAKALISGELTKEYMAVCVGVPSIMSGTIDAPIKREKEGIIKRCIDPFGKPSVTDYEVVEEKDGLSLVKLYPKTGRTHQLRLHLSHIGTPILGDFLYGKEISGERTRLHCHTLCFPHPFSGKVMKVSAPIPEDMKI